MKANQVYQNYTYSGFTQVPNSQKSGACLKPLTSNDNVYTKVNSNYAHQLDRNLQKEASQLNVSNLEWRQKENLKPIGVGIDGTRFVDSKVYEAKCIPKMQADPKEASI